ncbi:glycosyltransferase family 4 protein [Candidatus Falkowbacteria bacterium]|nr:glycosyltransferase family 4 protein [Candidatus Falkowbacteria bacterium]
MKIIYIANARLPTEKAHGYQIMKMSEAFADLGADLILVYPSRAGRQIGGVNPQEYYGVKPNFSLECLRTPDPHWLMGLSGGIYIKLQSLFFIFRLFFYLLGKRGEREIIFYTRDSYLLPILKLFSPHVILEIHDLPHNYNFYLKYWCWLSGIVSITAGLKDRLVAAGLDGKNILVAPDAVDLKEFENLTQTKNELRNQLGLSPEKNLIIYSGHLYEWKGAQILADAAQYLSEKEEVIFIGGTDRDIIRFQEKNQPSAQIMILGRKPRKLIPSYLKAADILILPNSAKSEISKNYTSPLKLFEYMASGRPIVASNLDSLKEILTGSECVFFAPDDANDLAQKINNLLLDKDRAEKISANAYQKVKNYTWENRAKNIIEFINYV